MIEVTDNKSYEVSTTDIPCLACMFFTKSDNEESYDGDIVFGYCKCDPIYRYEISNLKTCFWFSIRTFETLLDKLETKND